IRDIVLSRSARLDEGQASSLIRSFKDSGRRRRAKASRISNARRTDLTIVSVMTFPRSGSSACRGGASWNGSIVPEIRKCIKTAGSRIQQAHTPVSFRETANRPEGIDDVVQRGQ